MFHSFGDKMMMLVEHGSHHVVVVPVVVDGEKIATELAQVYRLQKESKIIAKRDGQSLTNTRHIF